MALKELSVYLCKAQLSTEWQYSLDFWLHQLCNKKIKYV